MDVKILVVDDNPDVLYTVKDGLETIEPSFKVSCVESGQECLDTINEINPDIVLIDIMMPGMDGWEVVGRLKADDMTAKIPIIYLTGKTDDVTRNMSSLTSADFIEKPFDTQDLKERILKAIGR